MEGPFSCLRLHWGDEFIATTAEVGSLSLVSVVVPRPYVHHRFLAPTVGNNDLPEAAFVHELGGGWESVAGGVLTLSVPAARSSEFLMRLAVAGIAPGALRLLD